MIQKVSIMMLTGLLCTTVYAGALIAQHVEEPTVKGSKAELPTNDAWWKHALVYEVYPRSFADSNGDGIGDLNGVTEHIGYLQQLGVDAIWLAPIYPSPQVDFGYDISDYKAIDPQYGTLADFDRLLKQAKQRNMRVVLDMVLNHTSDKSAWFMESASSRTNPKADWYVWNDGIPATSPNISENRGEKSMRGRRKRSFHQTIGQPIATIQRGLG